MNENRKWLGTSVATLLIAGACVTGCGGDEPVDSTTAGGSAGAGAGASGAAGKGGAAGGTADARTDTPSDAPVDRAAEASAEAGSANITCGTRTCMPFDVTGAGFGPWTACCITDETPQACGIMLPPSSGFMSACYSLTPGNLDPTCPAVPFVVAGVLPDLPGCCRVNGKCGGATNYTGNGDCSDPAVYSGGTAPAAGNCTPAVGRDGGDGGGTTPDAGEAGRDTTTAPDSTAPDSTPPDTTTPPDATDATTSDATDATTSDATDATTSDATDATTSDATDAATE